MGRHVCRELLLYLTPIRLLQENTNYYSSRMGHKIKDLPSPSHTLSKRRKKLFANSFLIVLAESGKTLISPQQLDLKNRFFLLSFSLSFPSFLSSPSVSLAHTYRLTLWQIGLIVLSTNVISMQTSNRIVSQRRLNKIIPRFTSGDNNNTNTK